MNLETGNSLRSSRQTDALDQTYLKKYYRFCLFRQFLLSINSSGHYHISCISQCAKETGLSYNTLRADIRWFCEQNLIIKRADFIRLKTLTNSRKWLYDYYIAHESEINGHKSPALYFSDTYKKTVIFYNVTLQLNHEASRCEESIGRKLKKLVNIQKVEVGERLGVYLALSTIGRLLDRGKSTAHKYINRMNSDGTLIRKKNFHYLGQVSDILKFKIDELYGRLTTRNGAVYERLQNSYIF